MRSCALLVAGVSLALGAGCGAQGESIPPGDLNLQVQPANLAFPGACAGEAGSMDVTATHVGTSGTLHVTAAELEHLGPEFTLAFVPAALEPGGSATVATVTFTPSATPGERFGTLVLHHDVASQGRVTRLPVGASAGQPGDLTANPNPLDFGEVAPGQSRQLDVQFKNFGCDPAVVQQAYLRIDGSPGFTVDSLTLPDGGALPLTLGAGESLDAVLGFEPSACGTATTTLILDGESGGAFASWSFDILGTTGPCPSLVVTPGVVDFQGASLDKAVATTLTLSSVGTADLVIPSDGIGWTEDSDPRMSLGEGPTGELTLEPGTSLELTIQWLPDASVAPADGTPIGTLRIGSNDPWHPVLDVPVFGRVDAPLLVVVPESVDLGFGAQMTPVERMVTVQNAGTGDLHVASVEVVDPSRTEFGVEWELSRGAETGTTLAAFVIPGNSAEPLKVVFTLRGSGGPLTATLRITSDDPVRPVRDVPLTARGIADYFCRVSLVPASLDFGPVAVGQSADRTLNLVNTGTGFCSFQQASVADCAVDGGGIATCPDPFPSPAPGVFTLVTVPPSAVNGIAPGASVPLTVRLAPVDSDPAGPLEVRGRLVLRIHDAVLNTDIEIPGPGSGTPPALAPNLRGQAVAP